MLYRLFINYVRLILFQKIVNRVLAKNAARGGKLSKIAIIPFVAELALTYFFDKKYKKTTFKNK